MPASRHPGPYPIDRCVRSAKLSFFLSPPEVFSSAFAGAACCTPPKRCCPPAAKTSCPPPAGKRCCPPPTVAVTGGLSAPDGYHALDDAPSACSSTPSSSPCCGKKRAAPVAAAGKPPSERTSLLGAPAEDGISWARIVLWLAWVSIAWNVAEGAAGVYAGVRGHQVAVLAFGAQSAIEVVSAVVVLWRLRGWSNLEHERRGTRIVGALLLALGLAAAGYASYRLERGEGPSSTLMGLVVSGASVLAMLALYLLKRRAAERLDSAVLTADAKCNLACTCMPLVVVADSLAWYLWGCHKLHNRGECPIWFVDSAATLVIGAAFAKDGVVAIFNSYQESFQGGCGCCSA